MLRLKDFELDTPETVGEAVALLAGDGDIRVIAGGTDIIAKMKRGQFEPARLVSLARIKELDTIRDDGDVVRIGAGTTLRHLEFCEEIRGFPCLHEAVRQVATPTIRTSGTVGGNLLQDTRCRYYDRSRFWRGAIGFCLKKGGEECRVAPGTTHCYATFCSDLAPALVAIGAEVTAVGASERTIALDALYADDGMAHVTLNQEILTEIIVPKDDFRSTYKKLRMRGSFDFPEIGVAVACKRREKQLDVRIAVTGVNSSLFTLHATLPSSEIRDLADEVYRSIKPMDTLYFPPAYRKKVARTLILRAFDELLPA